MLWFVCALLGLALGFVTIDALARYRALLALERGGFESELAEIAEACDLAVVQALRNELTVTVDACLAANTGRAPAHGRICLAAGGVALIVSIQNAPLLAAAFATAAALVFVITALLGRRCTQAARRARKRWRSTLGSDGVRHSQQSARRLREFQSG